MQAMPGLSISHYLCPPGYGALRFMDEVARSGATGVGLTLAALEELGAAACGEAARERGLAITSLNSAGNFLVSDPAAFAEERARNGRLIEAAGEMGAAVLVVVTGGLSGQTFTDDLILRSPRIWSPDAALARVEEELCSLAGQAAVAGVRLALEPIHPMDILFKGVVCSIAAAAALAARIEGLGLMLDLYHSWWDADLLNPPLQTAGLQICGIGQSGRDVKPDRDLLGTGIVAPGPALAALRDKVPAAFVEFEMFDRHRHGREVVDMICAVTGAWKDMQSQTMET